MDWLRRNWPDLLIGIALVAVIAGIIATLITGGSFFSVGGTTTATPPVGTPATAPSATAASPAVPVVPNPGDAGAEPTEPTVETPVVAAPEPAPQENAGPTVAVLPPTENAAPATEPVAVPVVEAATPEPQVPVVEVPAPEPAPAAPAAEPPIAEVTPSSNPEAPFRVSVGAFSTIENAERQAEVFRAAGYPVLIGAQDALSLVLIGPYDVRGEAERVAAQIEAAGLVEGPLIYTFEPAGATAAAPAPAAAAAPATADATPDTAGAADGGRYIQVGAYTSDEGAAPQRTLVSGLGFTVSSRVENGLIKLLIGPFPGQQLSDAQATLEAAGVAFFVR